MTVILTILGVFVFIFSLFTVGFKAAWKRLVMMAVTGLIIDVIIGTTAALFVYYAH